MGEIGIPRREFLYDLQYWEVMRIVRGYRRRERTVNILTRLQTFWQVKCSMAKTEKFRTPSDLWPLPWDSDDGDDIGISVEDQDDLTNMMKAMNKGSGE